MNIREAEFVKTTSFRMNEDDLKEVSRECRMQGLERSSLIRDLLSDWLESQRQKRESFKKTIVQIKKSAA